MEINRSNIMQIVNNFDLKPDKDYGQNFLVDSTISKAIVEKLEISDEDSVLEVGPGLGSLTHFILEKTNKYKAVDIDNRMICFLKNTYPEIKNNFINNDIRKENVEGCNKVISNLPYNITTETIAYLLKNSKNIKKLVLMCQSETFAHFSDVSGKEYGPISVLIHLFGSVKRIVNVKPGSFYPAPKCSSIVFSIDYSGQHTLEECLNSYYVSKQLFLNRRKTILNNMQNYLKDKEKALEILNALNISQTKRPEELTPDTYLQISKLIMK